LKDWIVSKENAYAPAIYNFKESCFQIGILPKAAPYYISIPHHSTINSAAQFDNLYLSAHTSVGDERWWEWVCDVCSVSVGGVWLEEEWDLRVVRLRWRVNSCSWKWGGGIVPAKLKDEIWSYWNYYAYYYYKLSQTLNSIINWSSPTDQFKYKINIKWQINGKVCPSWLIF